MPAVPVGQGGPDPGVSRTHSSYQYSDLKLCAMVG